MNTEKTSNAAKNFYGSKPDQPVYFTYKDRIFRLLFKDKQRLLELYNALNNTAYTDVDDLTVNTLENAILRKNFSRTFPLLLRSRPKAVWN